METLEIRFSSLRFMARLGAACGFLAAGSGANASDGMKAADIRADIVGHRIFLATPFGGEFPLNYRPIGIVDGDGEALGLGRFAQPADNGRWWVQGDRLCQKFAKWYDGERMCFRLDRTGPKSLNWLQDNGRSGQARIGSPVN